ncbi:MULTISPECIES: NAD(P)H-quinone oxidoreductase subunit O [unclassified Synechococcus]|uniref:NAD(P)H-quinone oxidoreductase subunit O n=1 Tax=unclassified Synechococcus TaxID=2626047 RepID=UPI0008FF24FC|nr:MULTISPECIES: NAD(P)H-quinone oxidoreductase subunit O [unclassified Synechococcus]APD47628.1 NAD(P)H-quinone oxidoreductase [Synechococcus sp. SynAce01]MCT0201631.1 NAD(P)H-quinone oxidoreductase subunit O [Synechococcus sp. CS-603]MCT0245461.1 NAD(P)H-quinone oxidoreductase subunit O [Synechococcus sp. CS-601]TWB90380.1 NADH-quinone oxidoreductase subunit O [Synechococcus sp. Ace-Pa]
MAQTPAPAFKKGSLVKVSASAYAGSLEASASDPTPPAYLFEGPGEVLALKGDYAQLHWSLPIPDVWLRTDQLEPF